MPFLNPDLNSTSNSQATRIRLDQASRNAQPMTVGEGNAEAVRVIQRILIALGDPACAIPAGATGTFGVQTVQAVKAFQRQHGLVVDGIVGKQTLEAMDRLSSSSDDAYEIAQLNQEIMRNSLRLGMAPGGIKFSRMVGSAHRLVNTYHTPRNDTQFVGFVIAVPIIVALLLLVVILSLVLLQAQASLSNDYSRVQALGRAIDEKLIRMGQIIQTMEAQAIVVLASTISDIARRMSQTSNWVLECTSKATPEKLKECEKEKDAMKEVAEQLRKLVENLQRDEGYITPKTVTKLIETGEKRLEDYRARSVDYLRCLRCI